MKDHGHMTPQEITVAIVGAFGAYDAATNNTERTAAAQLARKRLTTAIAMAEDAGLIDVRAYLVNARAHVENAIFYSNLQQPAKADQQMAMARIDAEAAGKAAPDVDMTTAMGSC